MPDKPLAKREVRTLVDVLFVVLVVSLSLTPFIRLREWDGYASGNFVYRDETYYVRYSDETIKTDKPHIFFLEGWPVKSPVDMVELSDYQSYVDGLNLYEAFESRVRLTDNGLAVFYSSGSLELTKSITVTDEGVVVTYEAGQPVELRLSLWRYYFSSVDGSDYRGIQLPSKVEPKETLSFEFEDGSRTFRGFLQFSNEPSSIEVYRDSNGLNKIVIDYVGSRLSIGIALERASQFSFKIADKDLIYPLMSIVFGLVYLRVRKYEVLVEIRPNRTER